MPSPDEVNMQKARIECSHQAASLPLCSGQTWRQAVGGKPVSALPYVTLSYLSSDQLALPNVIGTDYIEKYLKITASVCSWPTAFRSVKDFHRRALEEQARAPFVETPDLVLRGDDSPQLSSAIKWWMKILSNWWGLPCTEWKASYMFSSRCCSRLSHTTYQHLTAANRRARCYYHCTLLMLINN